jgi:flagellar hook protein FlgE
MMRGMYAAISGLEASQTMLDVTANNLANSDTVGFKSQSTSFVDELSQTLAPATAPNSFNGGTSAKQVGLGVQVGSIDNEMGTGSLQTTGNALDVAIQGNGFFEVGNGNPVVATAATATAPATYTAASVPSTFQYTRAGNLTLNSQGYLTTQSGQYVMGSPTASTAGTNITPPAYINVPPGSTNVAVGQDGAVSYSDPVGLPHTAGYLALASFPNNAGLTRDGGSLWSPSLSSGVASTGTPGIGGLGGTVSGTLEMSNVDMATEFTNMITAERTYQANSKVITTGDTMLSTLVNMVQG